MTLGDAATQSQTVALRLEPVLSAHLWVSKGGGTQFLETGLYAYKSGASHVEDLPPAGKSSSVFSFDLEPIRNTQVTLVLLDLRPSNVVGNPFSDYNPLMVREISLGDLSQILVVDPIQTLDRLTSLPSEPVDVTNDVRTAIERGARYFQVKVEFDGLFLPNVETEMAVSDSYVEWGIGASLIATTD